MPNSHSQEILWGELRKKALETEIEQLTLEGASIPPALTGEVEALQISLEVLKNDMGGTDVQRTEPRRVDSGSAFANWYRATRPTREVAGRGEEVPAKGSPPNSRRKNKRRRRRRRPKGSKGSRGRGGLFHDLASPPWPSPAPEMEQP